jgi:WXXGXW repeat (2 copies)
MNHRILSLGLMAAAGAVLLTGCVERRVVVRERPVAVAAPAPQAAVVVEEPPAPRVEVVGAAPSPAHVWIPGHWLWKGRWIWVRGHWEVRPRPNAVWIEGRWSVRGTAHVWVEGYWR